MRLYKKLKLTTLGASFLARILFFRKIDRNINQIKIRVLSIKY